MSQGARPGAPCAKNPAWQGRVCPVNEDRFDDKLAQWNGWCEAPWGRLRFAVVRETPRRQAAAMGAADGGLRVLDAGDVRRLAGALRPGGRLSVMAPNPAARVIMRLTREGPGAALAELETDGYDSATFDTTGRKVSAEEVEDAMSQAGLAVVGRYAARVANDYVTDDTRKQDPGYYAALERLELALCDREPFVRLGGLWQVVAQRPIVTADVDAPGGSDGQPRSAR